MMINTEREDLTYKTLLLANKWVTEFLCAFKRIKFGGWKKKELI